MGPGVRIGYTEVQHNETGRVERKRGSEDGRGPGPEVVGERTC